MNAPQNLDDLDDVDLAALSTRVLHDIVAKMTPEDRQRYRDALDAADAPVRSLLGAALAMPEATSAPGQKCATCRGAFSGMSWDTLCPSCWEEKVRNESAARRAQSTVARDAKDADQIARWKRDSELLMAIQNSCWDVRFLSHSNGDDCDISIEIIGHYMAAPHERVMGESVTENLRAALEQALTADSYPPARPEYDEYGRPVIRAASQQQEG
ncbi:hypothetical protein [Achromobacter insolitus]|uniref:hypothetical protein n=1 Tax=Achromobacter insolitus TaxID=217204 RepID=UPI00174C9DF3|nr:hypothetical protein [Achromobacter insolitus]